MRALKPAYFRAYFETPAPARPPRRFAVLTAWNPGGKNAPLAANKRRDAALRRRLDRAGLARFRVTGGSRDGSHREPGWGVAASPETARALCAEFRQLAYYWVSGGRIYVGAASGGPLRPAGSWKARRADWPKARF